VTCPTFFGLPHPETWSQVAAGGFTELQFFRTLAYKLPPLEKSMAG